ncbi:MAG: PEP-CTERM sorting domain-containing protein, partial [Pirellulales bacterium]|nr:PEP-CTERM sorting domain-containing protein [Pirellulales bacterium]
FENATFFSRRHVMFRFAFHVAAALALATAALAGAASAEVTYYVEDFENNGEPGFDTLFNHVLSAEPPHWGFVGTPGAFTLVLAGATDTISFNLPTATPITYGAVSLSSGTPIGPASTSVRFVGSGGTWETGPADYGKTFVEISAGQIGEIEQIELHSWQGGFRRVAIGVVPEPGTILLVLIATATGVVIRLSVR